MVRYRYRILVCKAISPHGYYDAIMSYLLYRQYVRGIIKSQVKKSGELTGTQYYPFGSSDNQQRTQPGGGHRHSHPHVWKSLPVLNISKISEQIIFLYAPNVSVRYDVKKHASKIQTWACRTIFDNRNDVLPAQCARVNLNTRVWFYLYRSNSCIFYLLFFFFLEIYRVHWTSQ